MLSNELNHRLGHGLTLQLKPRVDYGVFIEPWSDDVDACDGDDD